MKNSKIQFKSRKLLMFFQIVTAFALMQGCGGCGDEPSKINVNVGGGGNSGSAGIALKGLNKAVNGSDKEYIAVTFSGQLTKAASGETTGKTSFSKNRTYEVTSSNVSPTPTIDRQNLKPGTWKITVTAGTWTTSCTKTIKAKGATSVTFTYKQSGCK